MLFESYTEEKSRIRNPVYGSNGPGPSQNVTDPETLENCYIF
jgi:hypothetical protein